MSDKQSTASYHGLTPEEVLESRRIHGENVLTPPKRESVFKLFLKKFQDPLIIILLVAGLASIGISCYEFWGLQKGASVFMEPTGIFVAILLATGLGFLFEYKAEKEFSVLNQVNDDEPVQVIRSQGATQIPRRDVVVGDVIVLSTGEEVPADARLVESMRLSVDESTLTGEPLCHKTTNPEHFDSQATFPSDMVLRGTKVMEGHAVAVVTAVGDATENGKVYVAAQIDNSVKTPLNEQLDRLGRLVSIMSYIIGTLVIIGRMTMFMLDLGDNPINWMEFTAELLHSFMLAVALLVMSVPEGLPMAVTLSLAYSMRRMLRTDNLVRRMHACETMGAVTVICTDKTGTLTANRMQVNEAKFFGLSAQPTPSDKDWCDVMMAMALNSTAQLDLSQTDKVQVLGNPTEGALLLWIKHNGGDYAELRKLWTREAELPFSTERKFMATVVSNGSGRRILLVKGAPEIVYGLCNHSSDSFTEQQLKDILRGYQNQAMRTLGFASCPLTSEQPIDGDAINAPELRFDGVVAISDPVRDDVPEAIKESLNAGIKVKIVTGDTPATATEIARRVGLWTDSDGEGNITTGADIADMTDEQIRQYATDWKIIARARPMDKKRLVEALQYRNEVVAVTGDGTNDAPALKSAHVGLSMGDGTSVAKEASDITIINNSFSGITNAVMWGRSLYRNIQRFILFQLTINVAACLTMLVGSFFGSESPLTITQMLWVNLVMDTFAAMALASLPPSRSVLSEPPRDRCSFIINSAMARAIIFTGVLFFGLMMTLYYVMEHASITSLTDILNPVWTATPQLTPYELSVFFTVFVMMQMWNLFNARAFASHCSALSLKNCGEFILILVAIFFGQVLIVTIGGEFFNVVPLSISDWTLIVIATSPVLWLGEMFRLIRCRK